MFGVWSNAPTEVFGRFYNWLAEFERWPECRLVMLRACSTTRINKKLDLISQRSSSMNTQMDRMRTNDPWKAMAHRQAISLDLRFETEVHVFQLCQSMGWDAWCWICWSFMHLPCVRLRWPYSRRIAVLGCLFCIVLQCFDDKLGIDLISLTVDIAARSLIEHFSKRRTRIGKKMQFSMLTRMVESASLTASQRGKEVDKKQKKTPKSTGPKWLDLRTIWLLFKT